MPRQIDQDQRKPRGERIAVQVPHAAAGEHAVQQKQRHAVTRISDQFMKHPGHLFSHAARRHDNPIQTPV